jgi:hypothetical protein
MLQTNQNGRTKFYLSRFGGSCTFVQEAWVNPIKNAILWFDLP